MSDSTLMINAPTVRQINQLLLAPHKPMTIFGRPNELTAEEQLQVEQRRQEFLARRAERDKRWGTRR